MMIIAIYIFATCQVHDSQQLSEKNIELNILTLVFKDKETWAQHFGSIVLVKDLLAVCDKYPKPNSLKKNTACFYSYD